MSLLMKATDIICLDTKYDEKDYIKEVLSVSRTKSMFRDKRVFSIGFLLSSHLPKKIYIKNIATITDLEFVQLQQRRLFEMAKRTLALPLGRGMLTLRSKKFSLLFPQTEMAINLHGISQKNDVMIQLQLKNKEIPGNVLSGTNVTLWPEFLNSVAFGLMRQPSSLDNLSLSFGPDSIDFLGHSNSKFLSLCLLGAVDSSNLTNTRLWILLKDTTPHRLSVLLGIACSRLEYDSYSTQDDTLSRLICLHIPLAFPIGLQKVKALNCEVQNVALLSLGILYSRRANPLEIINFFETILFARDMKNSEVVKDLECKMIFSGFALGLVALRSNYKRKLDILRKLLPYLKRSPVSEVPWKMLTIREGNFNNQSLMFPAIICCIAVLFVEYPDNSRVLNAIEEVVHLSQMEGLKPLNLFFLAFIKSFLAGEVQDYEAKFDVLLRQFSTTKVNKRNKLIMTLNVVSGLCFGFGLANCGEKDLNLFGVFRRALNCCLGLLAIQRMLTKGKPIPAWLLDSVKPFYSVEDILFGSITISVIVDSIVNISCAIGILFAGSCQLKATRLLRKARSNLADYTYGQHMGVNMAMGMLYLGAGSLELKQDVLSKLFLLLSFFPVWPKTSNDHQHHHQIVRCLYVLAVK